MFEITGKNLYLQAKRAVKNSVTTEDDALLINAVINHAQKLEKENKALKTQQDRLLNQHKSFIKEITNTLWKQL